MLLPNDFVPLHTREPTIIDDNANKSITNVFCFGAFAGRHSTVDRHQTMERYTTTNQNTFPVVMGGGFMMRCNFEGMYG